MVPQKMTVVFLSSVTPRNLLHSSPLSPEQVRRNHIRNIVTCRLSLCQVLIRELGTTPCEPCNYVLYSSEDAAPPDFVQYHKAQLAKMGGLRDGYDIVDLHNSRNLRAVAIGEERYKGSFDIALVPRGYRAS
ncbi:g7227 [Coccomyxa viridis]|uniref:G7227 protein n=1 Tax=Coccomyxa viridis TaxID=1274662 RepID=A0ABP1FXB3_9CHLO